MSERLRVEYGYALHGLHDLAALQRREREAETAWQRRSFEALVRSGWGDLVDRVWQPTGYEPGADLNAALAVTVAALRHRAAMLPDHPSQPVFAGVWPDASPNARAVRSALGGGVVYLNTGLIGQLRILAQYTAAAAAHLLAEPELEADLTADPDPAVVREWAVHSIVGMALGEDFRAEAPVWPMDGQRDGFRQELVQAAVAYVVAHEYGHLSITPWGGGTDCVALDVRGLFLPRAEGSIMNSQHDELAADLAAYDILLADAASAPVEHVVMTALGAALALTAQTATWYVALALGSDDFGWSHPPPPTRLPGLLDAVEPYGDGLPSRLTERFVEWSRQAFGIAEAEQRLWARIGPEGETDDPE